MSRIYLPLVAGLLALPACPLVDLQADVQDACVTYSGVQVPAMPPVTATLERGFTVGDLGAFSDLTSQGFALSFDHGEVRATSGIADVSFVRQAQLAVASGDPSSTLPTLEVFGCDGCAATAASLEIAATGTPDAAPYLATGSLAVTIDLTGTPPAVAWTMDVDLCATGKASYELDE